MKKNFVRFFLLTMSVLIIFGFAARAQQTNEKKTPIPFPVIPFVAEYEYQPLYLSQDFKGHAQYSRIEAVFDGKDTASLQLILTDKETKKRVFYCASEAAVKMRTAEGKEALLSKIDFKASESSEGLPTYGFGFRDKGGQPVLWRVVSTTRPSERGAGLTPMSAVTGLRLVYRDIGTTIGEGTIVKIGEQMFEAEPWAEISSPPYFYGYHGSFTVGNHSGALLTGTEKWRVTSQPDALKEGAEWTLSDASGERKRVFRITALKNDELIINEQGASPALMSFVVRTTTDAQALVLRSVKLQNNSQTMQIRFEPELSLNPPVSGKSEIGFTVSEGKHDKIVSGTISVERAAGDKLLLRLLPKSPDWAKTRTLETLIKLETDGYEIETKQPAK